MDSSIAETPKLDHKVEDRQCLPWRIFRQRPQYPLWAAGRAGRIKHRYAKKLVCYRRIRKAVDRLVETDHPAAVTEAVDDETAFDPRALSHRLKRHIALGCRCDQDLRLAVVEDIGHLIGRQI